MNVRPAGAVRTDELPEALIGSADDPVRAVPAAHSGFLEGATSTGEAARHQVSVRIGLWVDEAGSVRKARWRAVREAGVRTCAEAACALLESGIDPAAVDAEALRRGAPSSHAARDCAEVVAAAVEAAVLAAAVR